MSAEIEKVIKEFIDDRKAFTALDVTNEVKKMVANVRHRDLKDQVHDGMSHIIAQGTMNYSSSLIDVTLADGSTVKSTLYHDMRDIFDLDQVYDSSKRNLRPVPPSPSYFSLPTTQLTPVAQPAPTPSGHNPQPATTNADKWKSLFSTSTSLFPNR